MGIDQIQVRIEADGPHKVPVVGAGATPLARVVYACHERTIDDGLTELAIPGLDRDTLEGVLTYCAEERCVVDEASCEGCRRRTQVDGLDSLDEFVAAHEQIELGDGGACLTGQGTRTLRVESLESLTRTWAGEKYWYWARRVLRKLRHGIRRAHIRGSAFNAEGEGPAILLMEPQLADNIGMVARAMANFGLDTLRLVAPRDGWPNEKARIAASGANYVIDDAVAYPGLPEAMGDLNWVAATTARQRDLRKPVMTPLEVVAEMKARIAAGQRCGVLFGRERNGLETAEVANADAIVMIPVNSRFASLNLAQAVLILGYEWMRASEGQSLGRVTNYETPIETGLNLGSDRPATKQELLGFFEHLEEELDRRGFFNPPEKRASVIRHLRTMYTRMGVTEQETRTLRGIVATLSRGKGNSPKKAE